MLFKIALWGVRRYFKGPGGSWLYTWFAVLGWRAVKAVAGRREVVDVGPLSRGKKVIVEHLTETHGQQLREEKRIRKDAKATSRRYKRERRSLKRQERRYRRSVRAHARSLAVERSRERRQMVLSWTDQMRTTIRDRRTTQHRSSSSDSANRP